jgi:PAS domain S-box-containing protein
VTKSATTTTGTISPQSPGIQFNQLADLAPGLIDVYDFESGHYVYVNKAIVHILGYRPQQLLDGGLEFITSRIHPDDYANSVIVNEKAAKAVAHSSPFIDDSKPFASFNYRVRHKRGHWVWLHTDASVFSREPDGSLKYIVNTCVNITELKNTQERLQQKTHELKASEAKLRALHRGQTIRRHAHGRLCGRADDAAENHA